MAGLNINGQIGPYQPGTTPGWEGHNAYYNFKSALSAAQLTTRQGNSQPMTDLFESGITFDSSINRPGSTGGPQLQTYTSNAQGYATAELADLSRTHQPAMDLQDIQAHVGVQNPFAQHYLTAVDTEQKGYVSPQNEAAYLAYSDVAPRLMAGTLNDLATVYEQRRASNPADPMSQPATIQEMRQQATVLAQTPTRLDGTITPAERAVAEWSVMQYPDLTRHIIQGIQQQYFSNAV